MKMQGKITISPEVLAQEVSGETVLLDLQSENYFGLDATATRIWQLLQEKQDVLDVYNTMLNEYDVPPERLADDIDELLEKLVSTGLVSLEDSQKY